MAQAVSARSALAGEVSPAQARDVPRPRRSTIACFIDAENFLIAAQNAGYDAPLAHVMEAIRAQGRVISARAYADWTLHVCRRSIGQFHDEVVELAQLASEHMKNTADIQLAVDAMEMILSRDAPDAVALVAGDRDFVPLVQKLRRYGKSVIGVGVRGSVSPELERACDTFIMLDDLIPDTEVQELSAVGAPGHEAPTAHSTAAFQLLVDVVRAQLQQHGSALASRVVQDLRERTEWLGHERLGYASFKDFCLDAQRAGYARVTLSETSDFSLALMDRRSYEVREAYVLDTPEQAREEYRRILLERKRVPLLTWQQRKQLVDHLWSWLAAYDGGASVVTMNDELKYWARQSGLSLPDRAIEKITHTLNIGRCFRDAHGNRQYHEDIYTVRLTPAVEVGEAIRAMHEVYVRGIRIADASVPLDPEGIAWLLYDDEWEDHVHEADDLVSLVGGPRMERGVRPFADLPTVIKQG